MTIFFIILLLILIFHVFAAPIQQKPKQINKGTSPRKSPDLFQFNRCFSSTCNTRTELTKALEDHLHRPKAIKSSVYLDHSDHSVHSVQPITTQSNANTPLQTSGQKQIKKSYFIRSPRSQKTLEFISELGPVS